MARYRQVNQCFLSNKAIGFWGNMVRNYDGAVRDSNFFAIVCMNFGHDKAVELIEAAYPKKALEEMKKARSRACRLDFSDSLDSIFQALLNNDRANAKCRVVLEGITDSMIDEEAPGGDEDPIERRFSALKRLLKLSEIESEILLLAYVAHETCFYWPHRVEPRDKPLFYAMALDRSFAEVARVMTAKSKLRKFSLLDDEWDFNSRTLCGYVDGFAADALKRQFYRKSEAVDVLPWSFYGELAKGDGETVRRMLKACAGKLDYLDDEGKRLFFERMFKARLTDAEFAELQTLRNLAPGDFRTVRQEQFYLAGEHSNADRIEAMKEECAVKIDGNRSARIGFAA